VEVILTELLPVLNAQTKRWWKKEAVTAETQDDYTDMVLALRTQCNEVPASS